MDQWLLKNASRRRSIMCGFNLVQFADHYKGDHVCFRFPSPTYILPFESKSSFYNELHKLWGSVHKHVNLVLNVLEGAVYHRMHACIFSRLYMGKDRWNKTLLSGVWYGLWKKQLDVFDDTPWRWFYCETTKQPPQNNAQKHRKLEIKRHIEWGKKEHEQWLVDDAQEKDEGTFVNCSNSRDCTGRIDCIHVYTPSRGLHSHIALHFHHLASTPSVSWPEWVPIHK